MREVPKHLLLDLLDKWEAGILSEAEVHENAEKLWEENDWPDYKEGDSRSIAIEVLSQLEILNHQLITKEDIPAIVHFLKTPGGQERDGWDAWRRYWNNLDLATRKERLKNHSYYCT